MDRQIVYRLIKFWNPYPNDGISFSDCSTGYEILETLATESQLTATFLRACAKKHGLKLKRGAKAEFPDKDRRYGKIATRIAIKLAETHEGRASYGLKSEKLPVYLGFVAVDAGWHEALPAVEKINTPITEEQANEVIGNQAYGVDSFGKHVDGHNVLVKAGWEFYHILPLLGYSMESFEEALDFKVDESGFYDDTESCSECGLYNESTNGYTSNFRYHDNYGNLGVECGCADKVQEENFEDYADEPSKCIELETAQKLAKQGKVKFVKRYVGGMTDGRGGYWRGEDEGDEGSGHIDEGDPAHVLRDLKNEDGDRRYLFSHDESGQFQTYWSVWEIVD